MDIGTGDFNVLWLSESAAQIVLTNLNVFSVWSKGHSILQPKWFEYLRNSNGMLESACASTEKLNVTSLPNLLSMTSLVSWNLTWWEYWHHRNWQMLQNQGSLTSKLFVKHLTALTGSYPHPSHLLSLDDGLFSLKGSNSLCCGFIVCIGCISQTAHFSLIYYTQPEREHCGVGCVAEDHQGEDSVPFANKLYCRSFYLSSLQLPLHYNKKIIWIIRWLLSFLLALTCCALMSA